MAVGAATVLPPIGEAAAAAGAVAGPSEAPAVDPAPLPPLPEVRKARSAKGSKWYKTDCQVFPDDNYWHADIRSLPTIEPRTPDGSGLEGFPVVDHGYNPYGEDLRLFASLTSDRNKSINRVEGGDPLTWVTITGNWQQNAEYTQVNTVGFGPFTQANSAKIRQRIPRTTLVEKSSTDNHALFLDLRDCSLHEYIQWSLVPGVHAAHHATFVDLESNYRRLSSRPDWYTDAANGPDGQPMNSPFVYRPPTLNGMAGIDMRGPRGGISAAGGSGMSMSPGLIRLDEVFANTLPGDQTVGADNYIDHAVAVTMPVWNVSALPQRTPDPGEPAPFVWPATSSDGCAGAACEGNFRGTVGSQHSIPMGSRLRLKAEHCNATWAEPQAKVIVDAMCNYGAVVTDTSGAFALTAERSTSPQGSKWRNQAMVELSKLTLRDFELVDTSKLATIDTDALWNATTTWARQRFGAGKALAAGWYQGLFWKTLVSCERPDANGARRCADPVLGPAAAAVNSPRYLESARFGG
jgi:hypothetical protein